MATSGSAGRTTFRLRAATAADLTLLVRHRRAMHAELHDYPPAALDAADRVYRRWIVSMMRRKQAICWIAEDELGAPAGSGCVWLRENQPRPEELGGKRPYLMSMFTDPAFRGRGVATLLASRAMEWSRNHGYFRLTLHASKMGRPIYERLGFTAGSEMRIDLPAPPVAPRRSARTVRRRRPASRRKPTPRKH